MTKIIIGEDDPMISEIYNKKFLESGFEVILANSGDQVLTLAKENGIDVILLDLMMPKMDGFEIIENLRKGDYDKNIKIFVSSNLSQREDREKAMSLGANGFLVKSEHTPSELVAEVNRLMRMYAQQEKNHIRLSGNGENKNGKPAKRILLIEDEEIFVEMFGEKLRQDGFEVESALNGAWGLKEAMKKDFDLFIIDMMMPAMNGKEIVEKLKAEEKTKNIPIIILSASVEDRMAREVLALGANCFFTKTRITPSEVSEKAEEILDEIEEKNKE